MMAFMIWIVPSPRNQILVEIRVHLLRPSLEYDRWAA